MDTRRNTRIPIPRGYANSLVRLGWRDCPIRVLDVSADGFAIACSNGLKVKPDQVLKILTSEGWYKVRVTRTGPLNDHRLPWQFDTLVGLERLECLGSTPRDGNLSVLYAYFLIFAVAGLLLGCVVAFAGIRHGHSWLDIDEVYRALAQTSQTFRPRRTR